MAYLGDLVIKISGDSASINSAISKAEKRMIAAGQKLQKVGKNLTKYVTLPFLAIGGLAVNAIGKQEEALAKLNQAIITTGRQGQISVPKLEQLASALQKVTTHGDEASLSALALVQQFADLNEEQLTQILPRLQDLSSALGMDLESVANLAGKSIGSSTNALSRYGLEIDATASKADKFNQLMKQIDAKFGGTAEAVAKKGIGPLKQFKNLLGDTAEQIGKAILPSLNNIIGFITKLLNEFNKLDDNTKNIIVTLAGIAVAIGPVLSIGGKLISLVIGLKKSFSSFITFISANPVWAGLIAAIVGAITVAIKLNEVIEESINPYQKLVDAQRKSVDQTDQLLTKYKDFSLQSANTAASMENQKLLAEELIKKYPELAENIDKETGALKLTEEQIVNLQIREKERLRETLKNQKIQQEALVIFLKAQVQAYDSLPPFLKAAYGAATQNLSTASFRQLDATNDRLKSITDQIIDLNKEIDVLQNPERFRIPDPIKPETVETGSQKQIDAYNKVKDAAIQMADTAKNYIQRSLEDQYMYYEQWASLVTNQFGNVFSSLGEALVTGEKGWENFGKAAIGAVASIIEALSHEFFAKSAGAIADALITAANPLTAWQSPGYWAAASQYAAAGAGAAIASGIVKGLASQIKLAEGGLVLPRTGGTVVTMAEAGVPEYAVPDKAQIWNQIADKISRNIGTTNNYNTTNNNIPGNLTLRIGDREFYGMLTQASADGKFAIHPTRGIRKR